MNTLRIALRNVLSLRRRWLGLSILLTLTVAVGVTALGLADNVAHASNSGVKESTANRSVLIERAGDRSNSKPLTTRSVQQLRDIAGVSAVEPRAQTSFGYKDAEIPGVLLYATTPRPSLLPPIVAKARSKVFPLAPGEIVLPRTADGSDLSSLLGRRISAEITVRQTSSSGVGAARTVTVVGLFDPSWQVDGQNAAYAAEPTVVDWAAADAGVTAQQYRDSIGYDLITVVAGNADDVAQIMRRAQALGYTASSLQQQFDALPTVLDLIKKAGLALLTLLIIVSVVAAFALTSALVRQRSREIGICKAIGFNDREIFSVFLVEAIIVAAISAAVGAFIGAIGAVSMHRALSGRSELAAYLDAGAGLPGPVTLTSALLIAVAIALVGTAVPARRAARLDPVQAMGQVW